MADLNTASWSETDASNNAAPPAGWPAGMFPNQVEPTAQAMMGALKRWWNRSNGVYVSTGAAGIYAVAPSNGGFPTGYVDGERYIWKAHQASQGADTLNWNALGAKGLYKPSTGGFVAVGANDIVIGQRVDSVYDATLAGGAGGFALMGPPTASLGAPIGVVAPFAGLNAPTGWLLCYGQPVSRTTYAALFGAVAISTTGQVTSGSNIIPGMPSTAGMAIGFPISGAGIPGGAAITSVDSGTQIHISANANSGSGAAVAIVVAPHGVGDGSSTFNLPDLRGRTIAGVDNMGGGTAGRITAGTAGVTGTTLGAAGGDQRLHQHGHGVSDPSHNHGVNDPGHQHLLHSMVDNLGSGSAFGGGAANLEITDRYTDGAGTGIWLNASGTGISIANAGAGASQNVQPTLMLNYIIRCAMHYHQHTMAEQMAGGQSPIYNTL